MKIPEAKAAVNIEWETSQKRTAWDEQTATSKADVARPAKKEPDGPPSFEERRTCETPPKNTRGEPCSGTTSRTKKDTEQYSQSKALQLHRRQRQNSWTPSQSWSKWRKFSVHSGQDDRSSQVVTIARRRMSRDIDQDSSTTRTKKIAIRLTILWLAPPGRNLDGHPLAGQLWERHVEEVLNRNGWEKVPTWECLCAHKELGSFLSVNVDDPTPGGTKGRTKNPCGKSAERYTTSKIQRHRDARKGRQRLPGSSVWNRVVHNQLTTTGEADKKDQTKDKYSPQKIRAWSYGMKGHAEKVCWEILQISKDKCILSPAGANTVHRRSLDHETTGELSAVCAQM